MSKITEKIKKIKEDIALQKEEAKTILKTKWDIGAEQGKALKKAHKEKIEKVTKKHGRQD